MISISRSNGADVITQKYAEYLLSLDQKEPLIGVEMGIAYGGNVEKIGKLWKDRGIIYGYDTFEGHPKHLVERGKGNDFEADCMDVWYKPEVYGTEKLSIEYQRGELDRQGLTNVVLRKGLVSEHSCDDLAYINYCLLDMDIYESMKEGYKAVKNKIVPGCFLFLHDTVPPSHIPRLYHWLYDEVMEEDGAMWSVVGEWPMAYLSCLKRNV